MSRYEFSLKQEVLLEKGAGVLGDLFRYERRNGIDPQDRMHPVAVIYSLVWNAKQKVLGVETETDLARIDAQFDMARRFCAELESAADGRG